MKLKESIKEKLNKHGFTRPLLNYNFRTVLFTVISLGLTLLYAVLYGVLGISLRSVWYGVLACYYLMIVIMRALVVFYHGARRIRGERAELKEKISRARIYRSCGIILCLLMLPLSISVMLMISEKATFSHAGLMIYVAATYTTYKVVMAIRNFIKARKSDDLTVRTARDINLADMLVSLLALQTAMFDSFGTGGIADNFNGATGAVVCIGTVIIGAIMIYNGCRAITRARYEENLKNQGVKNECY